jgi:hypothetical protein
MKIGIMHVMAAYENTPDAAYVKSWDKFLRKNIDMVKDKDTEVTFQVPRRGASAEATQYKFMNALNDVDVPFFTPGEVAMRLASFMGLKFGVVTASDSASLVVEENIRKYGLRDNAVRVRAMTQGLEVDAWAECHTDAHSMIKNFTEVSRKMIDDGAEVIIPGCMAVDPVLLLAPGCEKDYPYGLREVDGVPVMNVTALTIKVAESFVSLKKAGLHWI